MAYKYSLNEPHLDEKEMEYVAKVLQQGWLSAGGEYTRQFEQSFARFIGTNYALAVQSGTAALHAAMLAMGIGKGDKVVVPNYTCGACVTSVLQTGAEPVIIDIEPHTFGMDAAILEEILSTQKIKAVMLVHVYGFPVRDFERIIALCRKYNAFLLEDASEAHGATHKGKNVGSFGDMGVFSVRSEKMIGVGEGGLILTNSRELHEKAHFYSSRAAPHRTDKDPWWYKYRYTDIGMNYLLPHLLGAIGLAQMGKFPSILEKKRRVGEEYRKAFHGMKGIHLQESAPDSEPCYWLNCILIDRPEEEVREMGNELLRRGVEIRPAFWPLGDLPAFSGYAYGPQEKAMRLFRQMIVLPSAAKLADGGCKSVHEVVDIVRETVGEKRSP